MPSFLSLETPLSDSHIAPVQQAIIYDIVNVCDLVTVSLLNVLVTSIRFVLEPIGFACVTAPIHLNSYCTSSRNRD